MSLPIRAAGIEPLKSLTYWLRDAPKGGAASA
jgi:hypothetical protein